jgi:hypothetical protein
MHPTHAPHAFTLLAALLAPPALAQEASLPTRDREATSALPAPIELALELREREDPSPLAGKELRKYSLRQFLFPRQAHAFDTDPTLVTGLAGASALPERHAMPEFVSAEHEDGRSIHWHLLNAIYMNASRISYYAERAGNKKGRSRRLSRLMVIGEAISLPSVKTWDMRAREILAESGVDFVDHMRPLNPLPPQTPPVYRGVATMQQRKQVKELGKTLESELEVALEGGDLRTVTDLVYAAVSQLVAWEEAWGVHWHMSRHTIGSIGYTALHGEANAGVEGITGLTLDYLGTVYKHTIDYGRQVDRLAQPLHAQGSGIVVNEFTDQSFLQAYERRRALEQAEGLAAALRNAAR